MGNPTRHEFTDTERENYAAILRMFPGAYLEWNPEVGDGGMWGVFAGDSTNDIVGADQDRTGALDDAADQVREWEGGAA